MQAQAAGWHNNKALLLCDAVINWPSVHFWVCVNIKRPLSRGGAPPPNIIFSCWYNFLDWCGIRALHNRSRTSLNLHLISRYFFYDFYLCKDRVKISWNHSNIEIGPEPAWIHIWFHDIFSTISYMQRLDKNLVKPQYYRNKIVNYFIMILAPLCIAQQLYTSMPSCKTILP